MRVIAGSARGHVLKKPKGTRIRPTSDRVKEALFNIIAPRIKKAVVLDLFAGTGALGIEALSRGAAKTVFVDWHQNSIELINNNLDLTGLSPYAEVYKLASDQALTILKRKGLTFNVIFLDPPYAKETIVTTLGLLAMDELLSPGGMVVVEHSRRERLPTIVETLQLWQQRHYGNTILSFYSKTENNT